MIAKGVGKQMMGRYLGCRMELDEAIEHCKEKSNNQNKCGFEHATLLVWLTELRELKSKKLPNEFQSQVVLALGHTSKELDLYKEIVELCPDKRGHECLHTGVKPNFTGNGTCNIRCPRVCMAIKGESGGK